MKISEARYSGGELILSTRDADAKRFALTFKAGEYELTRTKQKRSLDANAYYWQLCGQLAKAVNVPADEIYRRHIKDLSNFETYLMQDRAVEAFSRLWCSNHLGRTVETKASKIAGCTTVLAYYGSSDFDKAQMSRLIDNCVQDCEAVGIETKPEEYIKSLLEDWHGQ